MNTIFLSNKECILSLAGEVSRKIVLCDYEVRVFKLNKAPQIEGAFLFAIFSIGSYHTTIRTYHGVVAVFCYRRFVIILTRK